jgi:hypothetical protein
MFVLAPAFSWKLFVAIGVPLRFKVHVPGPVMSAPTFVMTKVPSASGVHDALNENFGGTGVGVTVGVGQNIEATAVPTSPPPDTKRSSVP